MAFDRPRNAGSTIVLCTRPEAIQKTAPSDPGFQAAADRATRVGA